jgi:hypothetical protein
MIFIPGLNIIVGMDKVDKKLIYNPYIWLLIVLLPLIPNVINEIKKNIMRKSSANKTIQVAV